MTGYQHSIFNEISLLPNSALSQLEALLCSIDLSPIVHQLGQRRALGGRDDWPVQAMLRALLARIWLQHDSIASFRRELSRNPTLMTVIGFPLRAAADGRAQYRIPSAGAFTRFCQSLAQLDETHGSVRALFEQLRDQALVKMEDLGERVGYDGKAIESYSTGRVIRRKDGTSGTPSDADAGWGRHDYCRVDHQGRQRTASKRWFGYKLHVLADVTHELPLDFALAPANESEHQHCMALVGTLLNSHYGHRVRSFVADRGLDSDKLRRRLYQRQVLAVIDCKRYWKSKPLAPFQFPTKPLHEGRLDTLVYNERGQLYCICPETGVGRPMRYNGIERTRGCLKYHCPVSDTSERCEGRDRCHHMGRVRADAKRRIVRVPIDPNNLRTFGPLPVSTRKWRKLYTRRSAIERINARIDRDFKMERHYIRARASMQLHITLQMTVMLAAANHAIARGKPHKIRSLLHSLAA